MASLFSKIVSGEIPSKKVWEDDHYLAFLDIHPVQPGHTLVIPKKEVNYLFDMDREHYAGLMEASRQVAIGLKEATGCKRICVAVVGYEVPHAHVHLIPTNDIAEFPFPNHTEQSEEQMEAMAGKIREVF
jgi:histidine triad (HIT) family protein